MSNFLQSNLAINEKNFNYQVSTVNKIFFFYFFFILNIVTNLIFFYCRLRQKALIAERSTSDGNCGKCLTWSIGSAITWGNSFDSTLAGRGQLIPSGSWSPGPGSNLSDSVFPHIDYGFLGKTLPIITYHVSIFSITRIVSIFSIQIYFTALYFELLKKNYFIFFPITTFGLSFFICITYLLLKFSLLYFLYFIYIFI